MEMSVENHICGHLLLAYGGEFTYSDLTGNVHLPGSRKLFPFRCDDFCFRQKNLHIVFLDECQEKKNPKQLK